MNERDGDGGPDQLGRVYPIGPDVSAVDTRLVGIPGCHAGGDRSRPCFNTSRQRRQEMSTQQFKIEYSKLGSNGELA